MSTTILREIIAIRFSIEIISHTHTTHYYHYTMWQLHVKPFRFPFTQPHLHNTLHTGTRSPPTTLLLPTIRPTINCGLVLCAPPPCLKPFPSIPAFGLCCPTCPRRQICCMHIFTFRMWYLFYMIFQTGPKPPPTKPPLPTVHPTLDCRLVLCARPTCPNPLPPPPGQCCPICLGKQLICFSCCL